MLALAKTVTCYYPGREFPAISTTGGECALSCKHCSGRYLEGMIPAVTPDELLNVSESLVSENGQGFLLSGGCDERGRVRLADFIPAIEEIKSTTSLRINAHIGLTPKDELRRLVRSGIDAFSVDVFGDDATVREVTGLDARAEDYIEVVRGLKAEGAPLVAPHICAGIQAGRLGGEMRAIQSLREAGPDVLVVISLIPTRGTPYADVPPPSPEDVISVVAEARNTLPDTRLLLGCMRSKRDRSWEVEVALAGLDGIVLPSEATVSALRKTGHSIRKVRTCCAFS